MSITAIKAEVVAQYQRAAGDTGSPEVQVACSQPASTI